MSPGISTDGMYAQYSERDRYLILITFQFHHGSEETFQELPLSSFLPVRLPARQFSEKFTNYLLLWVPLRLLSEDRPDIIVNYQDGSLSQRDH